MEWRIFWVTFSTIFLAEMGDKTQLVALTFTADKKSPLSVFAGASLALCLATLLGVLAGGLISHYVPAHILKKAAGLAFVIIGVLILWGKW